MIFIREEGRIYHGDPQKPDAFIKYISAQDGVIKATSTVVDEALRGQGIAKLLLDELAALAREKHWTIIPVCSYVVTAFKRFKEYEDVIFNA
jgi:predicted GNAT family acetyltransferase